MNTKLINEKDDIVFKPDVIDYEKYVDKQDYRFFKKGQKITHNDLLPVISDFDED